jgi:exopolyphosphatase/pppGpp-phosphohydrolase
MSRQKVNLHLQPRSTLFVFDDRRTVALSVGQEGLAEAVLHHDPPTPAELERAIDLVEDALTGLHIASAGSDWLVTADTLLLALPGLGPQGGSLTRDAVELLFQRLASRALGTPVPAAELPHGREIAAALLILRECMHHLGFSGIDIAPA